MDFLGQVSAKHASSVDGMVTLLDYVAGNPNGPRDLPDNLCHQVGYKLWQFTKGRLRLIWFYDEGRVVVCAHAHFKKSQTTPPQELEAARKTRDDYLAAKDRGELEYERDE